MELDLATNPLGVSSTTLVVLLLSGLLAAMVVELVKPPLKKFVPALAEDWSLRIAAVAFGALFGWLQLRGVDGVVAGVIGGGFSTYIYARAHRFFADR